MSRKVKLACTGVSLLMILCFASAVHADPVFTSISGNTTASPTFNRPGNVVPGVGKEGQGETPYIPTSLSGLQVRYSVIPFTVSAGGNYVIQVDSVFDNFLLLYSGEFDAASPLANVVLASDNIDGAKTYAAFSASLSFGVTYFAVVTGSQPTDFGAFNLEIAGPGSVNFDGQTTPTPEPATIVLLGTGLAGIRAAVRRRRRRAGGAHDSDGQRGSA